MIVKRSFIKLLVILGSIFYTQNIIGGIVSDSSFQVSEKRIIPSERLTYYQNLPEYSYSKSIKYDSNIFKRVWNSFTENLKNLLGLSSRYGVNRFLFYLAICFAVIGLIYHLMRSQGTGMWHRKSFGSAIGDVVTLDDHLSRKDIEKNIKQALDDGKYRLAIRYHFIKTILQLDYSGIIRWKPELSNSALLGMVDEVEIKNELKKLIGIYEHTWYGKYEIIKFEEYKKYQGMFDSLTDSLTQPK